MVFMSRQNGFMGLGGIGARRGDDLPRFQSLSDHAWLPSDLTGVFTTSAGTTPAVPGDPVGLLLDCSQFGGKTAAQYMAANGITDPTLCPGKHFKQTTAGARPILARYPKSGVRNRLLWTEDFSNAAWGKGAAGTGVAPSVTGGAIAPDGATRAAEITLNRGAGNTLSDRAFVNQTVASLISGEPYRHQLNVKAKAAEDVGKQIAVRGVNTSSYEIITLTADWQAIGRAENASGTSSSFEITNRGTLTNANSVSFIAAFPQLESGTTATPYQRVTNAYDVSEVPYAHCYALVGGGLSKCMVTDALAPNSDKVTVVAGVRKLSDAAQAIVLELGNNTVNAFQLEAPPSATARFGFRSGGTAGQQSAQTDSTFPSPLSAVLTGVGDIANDICRLRIDGTQVAQNTTDQGSGNYGNHQLFLMARNQASLFFNGRWFGGSIAWEILADADRDFIEGYIAKNTMQVTL